MKFLWTFLFAFFLAFGVSAADGDACNATVISTMRGGQCFMLCDSDTTNVTCSVFDIPAFYKVLTFEVVEHTGCSAGTAAISHTSATSGLDLHTLTTLSLDGTGTTAFTLSEATHPLRYISVALAGTAGCTDIDVVLQVR